MAPAHHAFDRGLSGSSLSNRIMGSCAAKRMVAPRIRRGMSVSNVAGGVRSNRIAPTTAPAAEGKPNSKSHLRLSRISRRKPIILANDPGHMATALVAFAGIGARPSHTRIGKVSNVPPPATELIIPATNPASRIIAACNRFIVVERAFESPHLLIVEVGLNDPRHDVDAYFHC